MKKGGMSYEKRWGVKRGKACPMMGEEAWKGGCGLILPEYEYEKYEEGEEDGDVVHRLQHDDELAA